MINDVIGDVRTRILRHFPERQIYLRSGGEVKYYVLTTRLQMAVTSALALMSLWCVLTVINIFVDVNIFRGPSDDVRRVQSEYQRLLVDAQAKEENARLMLAEQKSTFEAMARNLEEKHATLSQIMANGTGLPTSGTAEFEYAETRVLMAPSSRDTQPRSGRRDFIKTAEMTTGMGFDSSLNSAADNQNRFLIDAEQETLDKIERNRALIRSTDLTVQSVLEESPFGKGGLYLPLEDDMQADGFVSRVAAIQARVAEVEALDSAVEALPLGHPVADETYRTSTFGVRKDPFTKKPTFHQGIDFGGQSMSRIVATADGVVSYVGRRGAYGRVVEIDHGHGFKTRFAHLNKTFVKRGQKVDKGTHIGGMGSTGRSTATHLHYEVHFQGRVYDPNKFLKAGLYVQ